MTPAPEVTVVIPVAGDRRPLVLCLEALAGQTIPRDRYEVVVVDNGCDPPAAELADGEHVIVLEEPEPGSYRARNRGIQRARGSIILFTDSDCLPAPDWIEWMTALFRSGPGVSIIAGDIEVTAHPAPTHAEVLELRFGFPQESYVEELSFGATANLAVRVEALRQVGPFNPELASGGDAEWCWRAAAVGLFIAFEPRAVVRHPARRTSRELLRKERRVAEGLCRLRQLGRLPSRLFGRAVLAAMLPPVISGARILAARSAGSATLRLRALLLLIRVRALRFRVLLACLARR